MIYVLKTSVKTKKDIRELSQYLQEILHPGKWNFDLEDCDKILRVDCQTDKTKILISELNQRGFTCEELEG